MKNDITVIDVLLRDGIEGLGRTIDVGFRADICNQLSTTGLKAIEGGGFCSPKAIPPFAGTSEVFKKVKRHPDIRYIALVPNMHGFYDAMDAHVKEITVFGSATESFCQHNINCSIEESFERFDAVIQAAKERNIKVRAGIACATFCPYEGEVNPNIPAELSARLYEKGCYQISVTDSLGVASPKQIRKLIQSFLSHGIPAEVLSTHFHNTAGLALANIMTALEMDVTMIEAATGGLGGCPNAPGAKGNVATEDVVCLLEKLGINTEVDLDKLITIGEGACAFLGADYNSYVGILDSHLRKAYF